MYQRVSKLGAVNCYLVDEDDGLTLIDTMITRSGGTIINAAAKSGKPIRRIVLTHAHSDHVGALDALAARLEGVEVIAGRREAKLFGGDLSPEAGELERKPPGGFPKLKTIPTATVEAGEMIGSLEVHDAPGHTPGQIALLDRRDGTLFCGDAYTTIGGVAVPAKPKWIFPFPYLATWDRDLALASARSLRELDPKRLAPGHGKVVEDPGAAMENAIAAAG